MIYKYIGYSDTFEITLKLLSQLMQALISKVVQIYAGIQSFLLQSVSRVT